MPGLRSKSAVPGAHNAHGPVLMAATYEPEGQAVQEVLVPLPLASYDPAEQSMHTVFEMGVDGDNVAWPAWHRLADWQAKLPTTDLNDPAAHATHTRSEVEVGLATEYAPELHCSTA